MANEKLLGSKNLFSESWSERPYYYREVISVFWFGGSETCLPSPEGGRQTKSCSDGKTCLAKVDRRAQVTIEKWPPFFYLTSFDGRRPLTEDDLWRKTTFDGRRPLTQDNFQRKTKFDKRRPLAEDDLLLKTILRRKTTFSGRRPLAHTPHHIPLCGIFGVSSRILML